MNTHPSQRNRGVGVKNIVVVLNGIRSLHNVGSIFRTADAAGVSKLYLCGITPKPVDVFGKYRKEVSKVALGAEKIVPWEHSKNGVREVLKLKKRGYNIFSVEQSEKSVPYHKIKFPANAKIALVMGSEVRGLPKSILDQSDKIFEIPMRGKKESLNVSVAFGIVIYGLISPHASAVSRR